MPIELKAGEFYGATAAREQGGVLMSIVMHERERRLPDHTHELPFLCLLLDGRYVEEAAGVTVSYEPLTLVFHPALLPHRDEVFAGSRMFAVEFRERWHELLARYGPPATSLYTHTGAEPLWIVLRLYELLRDDALSDLTVESLAYELIGSFDRMEPADDSRSRAWLRALREHLDETFAGPQDVVALAGRYDVHPVHLARAFRKAFKTNVGDYVHRRRIQQACRLLQEPGTALSAIAMDLGYTDQSHFNRVFRSITGTTPGRYRKAAGRAAPL